MCVTIYFRNVSVSGNININVNRSSFRFLVAFSLSLKLDKPYTVWQMICPRDLLIGFPRFELLIGLRGIEPLVKVHSGFLIS